MEVLGDWISVLEILQKAVESHPTSADHRFKLFACYVKIGNFALAKTYGMSSARVWIKLNACHQMLNVYVSKKNLEKARKFYDTMLYLFLQGCAWFVP